MEREIVAIGAGISGLTVELFLQRKVFCNCHRCQFKPGGSYDIFKRKDVIF